MECPRCRRAVDAKSRRCSWCGINVLPGQHLLAESGIVVPIKPAQSEAGSKARLASLGDRLIAMLLDCAIVLLACALINIWTFMKLGIVSGTELRMTTASILAGGSLSLLIVFLYVWLLEASFGCTLGKAIVGIGVVNNSERTALAASAIRNLLRIVDGFAFYLIGTLVACCSKSRRRLGDVCAGTYVVEGGLSELARSLTVLGWLILLGGGVWALPQVCKLPKPVHAPRHLGGVVIEMGRSENSLYFRLPNHGVDLSLVRGTPSEATRRASDEQPGKASNLETAETGVVR
jgi:uncharacterized RDD family membrane protein YckC